MMMIEKVSNFSDNYWNSHCDDDFGGNYSGNCWNSHCDDD